MSKLRERREGVGMRREELAFKAGISADYIRRLETNPDEANPTLEVARGIAEVLGTTVDELFPAPAPEGAAEAR